MEMLVSVSPPVVTAAMEATAATTPPGCFVEVGVYRGGSAQLLYRLTEGQGRKLHLFDTFTGMPFADNCDKHQPGEFADISLDVLRRAMPAAQFHCGIFPETMPRRLNGIAFAHVDCDQYRSVLACIDVLWRLVVPGGAMWFDDFGDLEGARTAVLERFGETDLLPAPAKRVFVRKLISQISGRNGSRRSRAARWPSAVPKS